ncbi:bifunctional inositol-1 monophosphatase/fructose-1,6-bisphosphatase [bacterium BMS3Abin05]|nr:bifunctional inositol-1 monophosphatase/fructose-1,6-bisphosphatase [bacterium BMS3Abin05]GBE26302.1 bifunctional inositol-1 monophosphatase/fructose-1,6-bisphosphatase [bacterium BMS3Bbin03]HDK36539.1 hypothetical protein [Bacteroidota bacterium]HDZ11641.1 hypothetical protein [Bacteroidota bacterium]
MIDFKEYIPVAQKIREAVLPLLDSGLGKEMTGIASSGDTTFRMDEIAERVLSEELKSRNLPVAYYSEDRGLVEVHREPKYLLIVDPVDGTRPAVCGFEMAVVSMAIAAFRKKPTFSDLLAGIIVEIKSGDVFFADKLSGTLTFPQGKRLNLSENTDLTRLYWSFDVVGRPVRPLMAALGDLIQGSAVNGGCFLWNSAAYSITRILLGQLDAYLDPGGKLMAELDQAELRFREAGRGRIVGLFPYDIAAAQLIARQGGVIVTDAGGHSLKNVPLIPQKEGEILSLVASAGPVLHEKLLFYLGRHPVKKTCF